MVLRCNYHACIFDIQIETNKLDMERHVVLLFICKIGAMKISLDIHKSAKIQSNLCLYVPAASDADCLP